MITLCNSSSTVTVRGTSTCTVTWVTRRPYLPTRMDWISSGSPTATCSDHSTSSTRLGRTFGQMHGRSCSRRARATISDRRSIRTLIRIGRTSPASKLGTSSTATPGIGTTRQFRGSRARLPKRASRPGWQSYLVIRLEVLTHLSRRICI